MTGTLWASPCWCCRIRKLPEIPDRKSSKCLDDDLEELEQRSCWLRLIEVSGTDFRLGRSEMCTSSFDQMFFAVRFYFLLIRLMLGDVFQLWQFAVCAVDFTTMIDENASLFVFWPVYSQVKRRLSYFKSRSAKRWSHFVHSQQLVGIIAWSSYRWLWFVYFHLMCAGVFSIWLCFSRSIITKEGRGFFD